MNTNTATKMAKYQGRRDGDAVIYLLNPPYEYSKETYNDETDDYDVQTFLASYVVVSAVPHVYTQGPETYIFPAKMSGDIFEIESYGELEGSYKGGMDHQQALSNLGEGYQIS